MSIADEIMAGITCQTCARPILDGEEPGYPRDCEDCE